MGARGSFMVYHGGAIDFGANVSLMANGLVAEQGGWRGQYFDLATAGLMDGLAVW